MVLTGRDLRTWVDRFATSEAAVRRDHLVSHVLVHLPDLAAGATLFGGTALCRTHLPDWRLSEDVDLLVDDPAQVVRGLDGLTRALRREHPRLAVWWERGRETVVGAVEADGLTVRVQLVRSDSSYRQYPTARTPVRLRYSDLPADVELPCPTRDGAAAMKLAAWSDRAAARDLCDLFGLVSAGALSQEALDIAARAAWSVQPYHFSAARLPSEEAWQTALGQQMAQPPDRSLAVTAVRRAVGELAGWD